MNKNINIKMKNKYILLLLPFFIIILFSGVISSLEWDNVKFYNEDTKTITIKNSLFNVIPLSTIVTATLETPHLYQVRVGYSKVAEFTINPHDDYGNILGNFDLIDLKKGEPITRQIDVKYFTIGQVIVGNQTEQREGWFDFNNSIKSDIPVKIGLFTNVGVDEKIEWITQN